MGSPARTAHLAALLVPHRYHDDVYDFQRCAFRAMNHSPALSLTAPCALYTHTGAHIRRKKMFNDLEGKVLDLPMIGRIYQETDGLIVNAKQAIVELFNAKAFKAARSAAARSARTSSSRRRRRSAGCWRTPAVGGCSSSRRDQERRWTSLS